MLTARRTASIPAGLRSASAARPARASVAVRSGDTNFFLNLVESSIAAAAVGAVTIATSENKDGEIARIQTLEGALPLAAAVGVDAVAHSIPGLNVLFSLAAEPAGAAAGVAYLMTLVLSSKAVDPDTLAPRGTVLNAEKAQDSRATIRVPFTQIVPTALKVVDTSNSGSSGAGWTIGENGLPKLPINSVLIVLGVGGFILEAAAHAPVLSFFLPRVLQLAGWLAVAGYFLDKRASK